MHACLQLERGCFPSFPLLLLPLARTFGDGIDLTRDGVCEFVEERGGAAVIHRGTLLLVVVLGSFGLGIGVALATTQPRPLQAFAPRGFLGITDAFPVGSRFFSFRQKHSSATGLFEGHASVSNRFRDRVSETGVYMFQGWGQGSRVRMKMNICRV